MAEPPDQKLHEAVATLARAYHGPNDDDKIVTFFELGLVIATAYPEWAQVWAPLARSGAEENILALIMDGLMETLPVEVAVGA